MIGAMFLSGASEDFEEKQTGDFRFLTSDSNTYDYWPCVSADGQTILFSRSIDGKETWSFFTVSVKGGEPREFKTSPIPVSKTRPNWLWSQNKIAFTGKSPDASFSVWIIEGDGTEPHHLEVDITYRPATDYSDSCLFHTCLLSAHLKHNGRHVTRC